MKKSQQVAERSRPAALEEFQALSFKGNRSGPSRMFLEVVFYRLR